VGKPHRWGASGPDAYDCSGLTMWAWAQAGVSIPRTSRTQYAGTPRVSRGDWQPGDLLFFGSPIHHVGMYIGNGQMVEAPYSGQNVRVNSAHRRDYVGAGRPGV
jgi:cell wall-associated NlpC family hydrolase